MSRYDFSLLRKLAERFREFQITTVEFFFFARQRSAENTKLLAVLHIGKNAVPCLKLPTIVYFSPIKNNKIMLTKIYYTATVTNVGARTGNVKSDDGVLDLEVRQPVSLGGPKGNYTNPEQLFAAAYAACFGGALQAAGKGKNMSDAAVTVKVHIGQDEAGGFGLGVEIHVSLPHLRKEEAEEIVRRAHETCPYSKATRGNIDVKLSVA